MNQLYHHHASLLLSTTEHLIALTVNAMKMLSSVCVLSVLQCWKEQAADTLAAAGECAEQQYLLMLGVLLAFVVLGPVARPSHGAVIWVTFQGPLQTCFLQLWLGCFPRGPE